MHVNTYSEQDKKKVFDLFEKVFQRGMTEEYWKWVSYHGKPIRALMWDDDRLVGHYALQPIPMKVGGDMEKILFGMSLMVDPDYQRTGIIFPTLANLAYEKAVEVGYRLALSFPNRNSYEFHFGPLGWKNFSRITQYQKRIEQNDAIPEPQDEYEINNVSEFDDNIDIVWKHNEDNYKIISPRTKGYLNWRFLMYPEYPFTNYHPFQYSCFTVSMKGEIQGYFVLKKFGSEKCHMVDYFGALNLNIIKAILSYAVKFCQQNKLKTLSFWSNYGYYNNMIDAACKKLGFSKELSDSYFGIKIFNDSVPPLVYDKMNWFVTMADSDVF